MNGGRAMRVWVCTYDFLQSLFAECCRWWWNTRCCCACWIAANHFRFAATHIGHWRWHCFEFYYFFFFIRFYCFKAENSRKQLFLRLVSFLWIYDFFVTFLSFIFVTFASSVFIETCFAFDFLLFLLHFAHRKYFIFNERDFAVNRPNWNEKIRK